MDELDRAGAAVRAAPIGEPTSVDLLRPRVRRRVRRRQARVAMVVVCALAVPAVALVETRTDRSVVAVRPVGHGVATLRLCSAATALSADVDADGRPDRVYLAWSGSSARLGVCTSSGATDEVDCPGQAQGPLLVVSLPTQPAVILCGASSVAELGFMPYVWHAGALHQTPLPAADQTEFSTGRGGIGFSNIERLGCPQIGKRRLLAQLTIEPHGSTFTWTRRSYTFAATGAHLVNTSSKTVHGPLTPRVEDSLVPACPAVSQPGTAARISSFIDPMTTQPSALKSPLAPPPPSRALDLRTGTLFGFGPGFGTSPDLVRKALTPILGTPTRDTGWYETNSSGPDDCIGHIQARVLRWGSVSYAFWHSNTDVLWSWTLGNSKAAGRGDRHEPLPIVEQPAVHATTADGIGVGTPIGELQRRLGKRIQLFDNKRGATLAAGVTVSIENGVVTGYAGSLAFC